MLRPYSIVLYKTAVAMAIFVGWFWGGSLPAWATAGTINSALKYAWSNNAGWVNFSPSGGRVQVTDAALTGYAWNDNYGWINLSPAQGGVVNDGEGVLSGYAWGMSLGWINFAGVTIGSAGRFHGSATGVGIGALTFDCRHCAVQTDWRPRSVASAGATTGAASLGGSVNWLLASIPIATTTALTAPPGGLENVQNPPLPNPGSTPAEEFAKETRADSPPVWGIGTPGPKTPGEPSPAVLFDMALQPTPAAAGSAKLVLFFPLVFLPAGLFFARRMMYTIMANRRRSTRPVVLPHPSAPYESNEPKTSST